MTSAVFELTAKYIMYHKYHSQLLFFRHFGAGTQEKVVIMNARWLNVPRPLTSSGDSSLSSDLRLAGSFINLR